MKKKDEKLADTRLKNMGILPKIYHFEVPMYPFRSITVADTKRGWNDVRRIIDDILLISILTIDHERSTLMRVKLRERDIHGVAICEQRDPFNRQRGRTIAKGRLWKHLKQQGAKRN